MLSGAHDGVRVTLLCPARIAKPRWIFPDIGAGKIISTVKSAGSRYSGLKRSIVQEERETAASSVKTCTHNDSKSAALRTLPKLDRTCGSLREARSTVRTEAEPLWTPCHGLNTPLHPTADPGSSKS